LSDVAVQRFYRLHARLYDRTRWLILHGRRRAVEELHLSPDSQVLEVGCGTGLNFRHVRRSLDAERGRVVGLDFSQPMLTRARKRLDANDWSNVELVLGDATRMEFTQPFDGVLFAYSLTMIPDWQAALQRGYENLRPGGRMVVLDFATFDGWGPFAPLARTWLRLHHVDTRRPYLDELHQLLPDLKIHRRLGGYHFTAAGTRRPTGSPE